MSIAELFGSSFVLSIIFAFIVFIVVFVYINYKMSEQDHKISSMLALISTMAQELDFFRNKIATKINGNLMGGGMNINHNHTPFATNKLIEVSDEDDPDDEDMDETYSSDDDNDDDDDDDDESVDEGYTEHVKMLNIQLGDDDSPEVLDISESNKELEDSEEDDEELLEDDIVSLNSNDIQEVSQDVSQDITRTIHLEETITNNTDLHFLKSLDINNGDDHEVDNVSSTTDYKKMSIQKLRSIVIEKGIPTDVSKMKKNEIVNLLLSS